MSPFGVAERLADFGDIGDLAADDEELALRDLGLQNPAS